MTILKPYYSYLTIVTIQIILVMSLVFTGEVFAQGGARSIEIKAPNGFETLAIGETYRITWDSTENIDKVTIGWTKGPGSLNWIANNIPNEGYYDWTLDKSVSTESLKIDITGYDTGYGSVGDQSDWFFTVVQASTPAKPVTVDLKIAGGDGPVTIPSGTAEILSWTSDNANFCYASVVGTQSTWGGTISSSGAQGTGNLTAQHTFTISCQDSAGNTAIDKVTVNVSGQPIITNFVADMPSSGSYINLQWNTSAPTDANIDFTCPVGSIEFYIKEEGRTVGCTKGGLVSYTNQSGNSISFNPRGNTGPVSVNFMLSLLKNGIPTGEKRVLTVTVPVKDTTTPPKGAPVITSIFPQTPMIGQQVTIHGSGFNNNTIVSFVGRNSTVNSIAVDHNNFTFGLPVEFGPGSYTIRTIEKAGGPETTSNTFAFSIIAPSKGTVIPLPIIQTTDKVFTRNLWRGMRNEDVRKLQELLAQDLELYPQGIVSGYFGFLTEAAIQNFQCKYGIVCSGSPDSTGYGLVGPKTRAKLNEVFGSKETTVQTQIPLTSDTTTGQATVNSLQQQIQQLLQQIQSLQSQVDAL